MEVFVMKIAISTDGNYVSEHFGRCPQFTIAEIEDGNVLTKEVIANPGHRTGSLPQFLHEQGVSCIICGGMGSRAREMFDASGIQAMMGITGLIDEVIKKYAKGELVGGPSLFTPGAGKGYGIDKSDRTPRQL